MNIDLEKIYYDNKHRNHKIPRVYYKKWAKGDENSKKNQCLEVVYKNSNQPKYIAVSNFAVENDAFIFKFGDIFLPDIVKEHFKKITDKYDFKNIIENPKNVEALSLECSCNKNIKILHEGKDASEEFKKEISSERCCCIENGLNMLYENRFSSIINTISNELNRNRASIILKKEIIDDLLKIYISFYFRSDESYVSVKNFYPKLNEKVKSKKGYENGLQVDDKYLFKNARRMCLWAMLFEHEEFDEMMSDVNKKLHFLFPCIHVNKTKQKFYTSDIPIIKKDESVFMVLTPELLLEYIPPTDTTNSPIDTVFLKEINSEKIVGDINNSIKEQSNFTVIA